VFEAITQGQERTIPRISLTIENLLSMQRDGLKFTTLEFGSHNPTWRPDFKITQLLKCYGPPKNYLSPDTEQSDGKESAASALSPRRPSARPFGTQQPIG
jgi:hypothetical protein